MIALLIFAYFLAGMWSAERFREQGDLPAFFYVAAVLLWPAFWFVMSIEADKGDEDESGR